MTQFTGPVFPMVKTYQSNFYTVFSPYFAIIELYISNQTSLVFQTRSYFLTYCGCILLYYCRCYKYIFVNFCPIIIYMPSCTQVFYDIKHALLLIKWIKHKKVFHFFTLIKSTLLNIFRFLDFVDCNFV